MTCCCLLGASGKAFQFHEMVDFESRPVSKNRKGPSPFLPYPNLISLTPSLSCPAQPLPLPGPTRPAAGIRARARLRPPPSDPRTQASSPSHDVADRLPSGAVCPVPRQVPRHFVFPRLITVRSRYSHVHALPPVRTKHFNFLKTVDLGSCLFRN